MLAARRPILCGVYPLLLNQAKICTSVAMKKGDNDYEFIGELGDQPFEVDAGGMGCCLIERQVLKRIEYPWFSFKQRPGCKLTGEDIRFFEQAAKLGIKPLVIPQIQCSHIQTIDLLDVIRAVWKARACQPQPVGA